MVVGGGGVGWVVGYTPAAPPFVILAVLTRSAAESFPSRGRNRESSVSSYYLSFFLSLSLSLSSRIFWISRAHSLCKRAKVYI